MLQFEKTSISQDNENIQLTWEEAILIMKESTIYNVHSEKTYRRRAQTVVSWIDWILGLQYT